MKNSRIAQQLRDLSLSPSLESEGTVDVDANIETGPDGEGVVKTDVAAPETTPADGQIAASEDVTLTTAQVDVDNGSDTEAAETVVTDSEVVASTESDTAAEGDNVDADTTTGDGEQIVKAQVDAIDETPADGAGAPGEDAVVEAVVVEVGERSELETAETESTDSADLTVSIEGVKGAVTGFLLGTGAGFAGGVAGSFIAGPAGTLGGAVGARSGAAIAMKSKRMKLKQDIEQIASRIAAIKNGDVEKAKKEGSKVAEELEKVDRNEVLKSALLGSVVPFYDAYQGHKTEQLQIELAAKIAELKLAFAFNGVSVESFEEGEAIGAAEAAEEDAIIEAIIVEIDEGSELESAETIVQDSAAEGAVVSTEGIKDIVGFVTSKEKRLAWSLKKLPGEIERAKKTIAELKGHKADAIKKNAKLSVQVFTTQIAEWENELTELLDTQKSFKADLVRIQAEKAKKAAAKVSQESDTTGDVAVAAAAGVAEGAAAAAEAVAAAVQAVSGEEGAVAADVSTTEVQDAVEEAADAAADASEEAAEAVDAVADAVDSSDEAVETASAEIEELEEAIAEGDAHAEKYEEASATLESLIDTLADAQKSGGLTPQAARIYQISFESIGVRLTGKPFQNRHGESAVPSMESFGGTMRRDEATRISMENAQDWFAKIWEVLKRTAAQVKEWLVKFAAAVFDQSERYYQRAAKIKSAAAAAAKSGAKPKEAKIDIGASAGKIAVGQSVSATVPAELVAFVKEAATRGAEDSKHLKALYDYVKDSINHGGVFKGEGSERSVTEDDSVRISAQRSAVFSAPYSDEENQGFKTKVMPGNVVFAAVSPTSLKAQPLDKNVQAAFKGWKVVVEKDEVEVSGEQKTLSLTEIGSIASEVQKLIDAVRSAKTVLKGESLNISEIQVPKDIDRESASVIRRDVWVLTKSLQWHSSAISKMLKYAVGTSGAFLDYAAASLKQYDAPAQAAA